MRVAGLRLDVLEVPLRAPLSTGTAAWTVVRLGLLRLRTDDGREGVGELALDLAPGQAAVLDAALLDDLEARLAEALDSVDLAGEAALRARSEGAMAGSPDRGSPGPVLRHALRSALSTAVADLMAQARGIPLATALADDAVAGGEMRSLASPPAGSVAVNALLGIGDPESVAADARRLVEAGFTCLKLKGGLEAPGAVARRVAAVRQSVGPLTALRLDLNGALDERSAGELLRDLVPCRLEYVEQPVPASAGVDALERLRRFGVPIAADEAVTDLAAMVALADAGAVDAVVVKPARVGGPTEAARIVELALAAGTQVTVATLLESGIGVTAAVHLAATVPGHGAHGLSTSGLLASDLLARPLAIQGGRLSVPDGPGLGVVLDLEAVERYSVAGDAARG